MYELEETPDYAPEGAVEGMTVENENVLILQDRDFDTMDADAVGAFIEESFNDLEKMTALNHLVSEALKDSAKGTKWLYNRAVETRVEVSRRHGGVIVGEAIYTPMTSVMVFEEEDKKEMGLIARIVDSIVKAFQWLWKKITGVFSSKDKDPEEKEKGLDAAADQAKTAEEAGVQAGTIEEMAKASSGDKTADAANEDVIKKREDKIKKFNSLLGRIDPPMEAPKIIAYYKKLQEELQKVEALFTTAVKSYNLYEKTISEVNKDNLADAITTLSKTIPDMLMAGATRFESINATIAAPYFTDTFAQSIGKAYRVENLAWGKDLCIAESGGEQSGVVQISYKSTSKYTPGDVKKIHILSSSEQKQLSEAVKAFGKKLGPVNESAARDAKMAKDPTSLKRIVKLFEEADLGEGVNKAELKKAVHDVGGRLIKIVTTLAGVIDEFGKVHSIGVDWVKECSAILNDMARNINKGKKEGE